MGVIANLGGVRFLLSRRWAMFAIAVILGAWGAWVLGQWQFHRLQERRDSNATIRANLAALPAPIDTVMAPGEQPSEDVEWRRVTVHGTYDDAHTIVLKYQTREGTAGVDVVTPLVTADGTAVLVDRGWMQSENSGNARPDLPPATAGKVTVTGLVRLNASGGATDIANMATRAVSSDAMAGIVDYPLYGGFIDLDEQSPPVTGKPALQGPELPDDTSDGPHFFYGLQWWFFGILAVFGFFYLMYDEFKRSRDEEPAIGTVSSQGTQHAPVDGEHHPGHE